MVEYTWKQIKVINIKVEIKKIQFLKKEKTNDLILCGKVFFFVCDKTVTLLV